MLVFSHSRRLNRLFQPAWLLLAAAGLNLSHLPAEAACTRWQAEATWLLGQVEETYIGTGKDRQAALFHARIACAKLNVLDTGKQTCRTGPPTHARYLCADGKCVHARLDDSLGWRRGQGWSREAFCIDRGFDGVIRDAVDDQSGVCYKGECE